MKTIKKKLASPSGGLTTCSRGHKFYKSKTQLTCPKCWPGRYKSKK